MATTSKTSPKIVIRAVLNFIALISNSFNLSNVGHFFRSLINCKRFLSKFRKTKRKSLSYMFTSSIKREIKTFHIVLRATTANRAHTLLSFNAGGHSRDDFFIQRQLVHVDALESAGEVFFFIVRLAVNPK